jgi:hypothetical protein
MARVVAAQQLSAFGMLWEVLNAAFACFFCFREVRFFACRSVAVIFSLNVLR